MLAYIARFECEEWCALIHGETRGKAKANFMRWEPSGSGFYFWNNIRLLRLPGQDDKPFTYDNAKAAGFEYITGDGDDFDGPEYFSNFCNCELCKSWEKEK